MPAQSTISFEQGLARRVMESRARLSKNDHLIVGYLQQNAGSLAFRTSAALPEKVGVSQAAIIRFAHRVGYSGFKEMRDVSRRDLEPAQIGHGRRVGRPSQR